MDEQTTDVVTLTTEERAEALAVLRETTEWAIARSKAGRSSMPIYVNDALLIVALAARALGASADEFKPAQESSDG